MGILALKVYPDSALREKAKPIKGITPEIGKLAEDMVDTMVSKRGLGLAAPQVGKNVRLITINLEELELNSEPQILVNPEVLYIEGVSTSEEGCLSFPGLYFDIERPTRGVFRAIELKGETSEKIELDAEGLYARVLFHEIDHINGILFIDRVDPPVRRTLLARWKREYSHQKVFKEDSLLI